MAIVSFVFRTLIVQSKLTMQQPTVVLQRRELSFIVVMQYTWTIDTNLWWEIPTSSDLRVQMNRWIFPWLYSSFICFANKVDAGLC